MLNIQDLSLEQQFKLRVLQEHIQGLTPVQMQKLLLKAVKQNMLKTNIISDLDIYPTNQS